MYFLSPQCYELECELPVMWQCEVRLSASVQVGVVMGLSPRVWLDKGPR